MVRRALKKEFYMEVRKTLNRFLSILLINALGVAFFAGVRASKPDMRLSADAFFDESDGVWGYLYRGAACGVNPGYVAGL